jgi:hypothetical protein
LKHPTLGTSKESVKQPDYLVVNLNTMQKTTIYLSPRRNFKTTGRWHKKSGQNKAGINLKYRTLACKQCPVQHCTTRPAGREIDRAVTRKALKKNKRYQENPQLY